jgi:predicted acylesterase/phospholipase RssA
VNVNAFGTNTITQKTAGQDSKKIPEAKALQPLATLKEDKSYLKQLQALQKKLSNLIPKSKSDSIGLFNLTNKSISLMLQQLSALTLANHHVDMLINIPHDAFNTYDFYKAKDIIASGENAAEKAISAFNATHR